MPQSALAEKARKAYFLLVQDGAKDAQIILGQSHAEYTDSSSILEFGPRQSLGVERSEVPQYYNIGVLPIVQPRELSRWPKFQD